MSKDILTMVNLPEYPPQPLPETTAMPTLFATLLASCGSFLVGKLIAPLWLSIPVSTLVWLVLYIYVRKILRDMRP